MKVIPTSIPDVLILEPKVFSDTRGYFLESWNKRTFEEATGINAEFVQDNHSRSIKNTLRGLHYQIKQPQGKLVRVITGSVYDVAVDLRKSSDTYGKWVGVELTEESNRQLWIPQGFAHGFLIRSAKADFAYKTTDYYAPEHERCLKWNDPAIAIDWPLDTEPLLSGKDAGAPFFNEIEVFG